MSRAVYSRCFLVAIAPTLAVTHLVEPGWTAILNHMTLYCPTQGEYGSADIACQVTLDGGLAVVWLLPTSGLPRGVYQWTGREVFSGDISFAGKAPYGSFRANGFELSPT